MKELWLFTRHYPKGNGETFLRSALPVWAACFDRVRVVPMFDHEGPEASLPEGVVVERIWPGDEFRSMPFRHALPHAVELLRLMRDRGDGVLDTDAWSHARQLMWKARALEKGLFKQYDPDRAALLSVWMEDWLNTLGILKRRIPGLEYASLAHGSDLYAYRSQVGRIPYRSWQMREVDQVICISGHGAEYLRAAYPDHASKVATHHLGTIDHGSAPWEPSEVLRLVSCSHLRPPKRVLLLAEALAGLDRPVHWTHFGDGPQMAELKGMVDTFPAHVTADLRGSIPNAEVLRWYQEGPVDAFVHLSDHEGIPVALMEAASFGIPLVANDVGGVQELVNERTGILLPSQVGPDAIKSVIQDRVVSELCHSSFHAQVRAEWKERFEAAKNFGAISSVLGGHFPAFLRYDHSSDQGALS